MKCPCEGCISYAICNAFKQPFEDHNEVFESEFVSELIAERICLDLAEFIEMTDGPWGFSMEKIREVNKVFNLC